MEKFVSMTDVRAFLSACRDNKCSSSFNVEGLMKHQAGVTFKRHLMQGENKDQSVAMVSYSEDKSTMELYSPHGQEKGSKNGEDVGKLLGSSVLMQWHESSKIKGQQILKVTLIDPQTVNSVTLENRDVGKIVKVLREYKIQEEDLYAAQPQTDVSVVPDLAMVAVAADLLSESLRFKQQREQGQPQCHNNMPKRLAANGQTVEQVSQVLIEQQPVQDGKIYASGLPEMEDRDREQDWLG